MERAGLKGYCVTFGLYHFLFAGVSGPQRGWPRPKRTPRTSPSRSMPWDTAWRKRLSVNQASLWGGTKGLPEASFPGFWLNQMNPVFGEGPRLKTENPYRVAY